MLDDNEVIEEYQLVYGDHTEHLNINKLMPSPVNLIGWSTDAPVNLIGWSKLNEKENVLILFYLYSL